jgi:hypothetical protein
MRTTLLLAFIVLFAAFARAQEAKTAFSKTLTPYAGILMGGCVDMPVQFNAGLDRQLRPHLTLSYDLHFWNTTYECYCGDTYSNGRYTSITPSVKLSFYTGKKPGRGLIAGAGLGYMFARDRGTEQTYLSSEDGGMPVIGKNVMPGNWDFNSLAPSVSLGAGFGIFKFPVQIHTTYYFANTTQGWMAAAGGIGLKFGLKRQPR